MIIIHIIFQGCAQHILFKDERLSECLCEFFMQSVLVFKMCFNIHIKDLRIVDSSKTVCDIMHRNSQQETVIARCQASSFYLLKQLFQVCSAVSGIVTVELLFLPASPEIREYIQIGLYASSCESCPVEAQHT